MEQGMKDRVLSDKQRNQIKTLIDYEDGMELFASSEDAASVTGSFVANDLGASMDSLRQYDVYEVAVYSEDHEVPQEELEGEALQFALKGDPIPGSLGDENY